MSASSPASRSRMVHERMHLTLKRETAEPTGGSMRAQQRAFDRFRQDYDKVRPHEARGLKVPADFFARSERKLPKDHGGGRSVYELYDGWETVRVSPTGRISCNQRSAFISVVFRNEDLGLRWRHRVGWDLYFGTLQALLRSRARTACLHPSDHRAARWSRHRGVRRRTPRLPSVLDAIKRTTRTTVEDAKTRYPSIVYPSPCSDSSQFSNAFAPGRSLSAHKPPEGTFMVRPQVDCRSSRRVHAACLPLSRERAAEGWLRRAEPARIHEKDTGLSRCRRTYRNRTGVKNLESPDVYLCSGREVLNRRCSPSSFCDVPSRFITSSRPRRVVCDC